MRALLWLLTLAALAVGLSLAARYNDGYVLVVLPPWRAELSLNLAVLLAAAGFLLLYFLLRVLVNALRLPGAVREFRERRQRQKADARLRDAMRLLQEGRYGHALKNAEAAFDAGLAPGMAALIALRASHAMRETAREAEWRGRARAHDAEIRAARLMTEAEIAIEARRFDEALSALAELSSSGGRHIAALRLSLRARQGMGDWDEVLRLVHNLQKHKALTPEQAAPLRLRAHRENLRALSEDAAQLVRYWNGMPRGDQLEPQLALAAAKALIAAGDCGEAARIVEDCLDERWDSSLVALYAECEGGDVLARIAHAEKWLESHPRDGQLLMALGRLCRQRQLWGKAQSYLEVSLSIAPSRAAHIELARLLDLLERPGEADRHYRAAAIL